MKSLEKYIAVKELGNQKRRKFGKTVLVKHIEDNSLAVLKTIQKKENNLHVANRLQEEHNFSFQHKGLPRVLDYSTSDDQSSLLLEHKSGVTLDQYWSKLKKRERLPFLIEFLDKLSPVFNHLILNKIVHCDLKPSNFIIKEKESDFNVHLIDFGLAIQTNEPNQRSILFPLGYAAPELILNHLEIVNHSTDLFALANVIWRLYTGELPLIHRNPSIFTNLQITHPLPEHSNIPKQIFKILSKMSKKHQFRIPPNRMDQDQVKIFLNEAMQQRYQNVDDIVKDLRNVKIPFYQMISLR